MVPTALHPAELSPAQLLEACDVRRTRRSGPGGQHRNKVETAVVITHQPSGVKGEASERRSQSQNHRNAVFRLRVNLALAVRCRREPPDSPSPLWQSRCAGGRISISPTHDDFPALLAEALDVLATCELDVKSAAAVLQSNSSQLTRFLKLESRALAQVNTRRQDVGRRPLR